MGRRKGTPVSEEHRRKLSIANSLTKGHRRSMSVQARHNISEGQKGRIPWNKGLTKETSPIVAAYAEKRKGQEWSAESRAKLSQATKGRKLTPERREQIGRQSREYYQTHRHIWFGKHPLSQETKRKISAGLKIIRDQCSETTRQLWKNPHFIAKQMKARGCKPNKPEVSLQKLLDKHFPNQWKFVGDGQVVIGGRCPDFININGRKQVIELFGKYWHDILINPHVKLEKTEVATCYHYSDYGFACLVIWEGELKKPSKLRKKLDVFVSKK